MLERDILIVGGGPGGLSTALHLARDFPHLTSRLLVLEKARYPRPKLCAGGLVLDAEVILGRLGLDVGEVPHVDVGEIHFDFEAKGLSIRLPRRHALRVIRRDEFDNWLAQKARDRGIEVREGIAVRKIIPDRLGVTVEAEQDMYRAKVVVGADGSNGITRQCILPGMSMHTARALEIITPARAEEYIDRGNSRKSGRIATIPAERVARNDMHREGVAYFDFLPVPDNIAGYIWDFPTRVHGEAMRCWGIYDTNILAGGKRPKLRAPLAREMARLGFNLDEYEVKGHPIRWFSPENPMSVPRVLLVGDAAGADPLFGEGISIALGYGAVAAREIGESFQRCEFSFAGYRRRVVRSPLGQAMIARWLIAYTVYCFKWKWFQILLWRILKPVVLVVAWVFVLNWGRRLK